MSGIGRVGLGDFIFKLAHQVIKLAFGQAQGFGVIAEDALGRVLYPAFQFVDALSGTLFGLAGLREQFLTQQFGSDVEGFASFLIVEAFKFVVKGSGEHSAFN